MTSEADTRCYRHPERVTGLRCTECNRPICGECSIEAAVGQRCPQCVARAGRQRTITARTMQRPSSRTAPLTFGFIGVAVAIHLLGIVAPAIWESLFVDLAMSNVAVTQGQWYRMFSVTLLHASLTHILFNMYALYILGPGIEMRLGAARFAALFVSSAAAGSAFAVVLGQPRDIGVGASGAVFGLFGVWFVSAYIRRNTRMGRAMLNNIWLNLAINAAIPLFIPSVSWQAHLGGFLAGALFGWAFLHFEGRGSSRVHLAVAAAITLASVVVTQV